MRSPITAPVRLALAAVAVGVVLVGAVPVVAAAPTPAPARQGAPDPAWKAAMSKCVAGDQGQAKKTLDVLFLVDESQSLRDTDPVGVRVEALRAALLIMAASLRNDAGNSTRLNVGLAGFGVGFNPRVDFQPLNPQTVGGLADRAEFFRGSDDEFDTDYFAALQQAQSLLSARSAAVANASGQPPCQLIVWFTDGQYDVEDRITGATEKLPLHKEPDLSIDLDERGGGDALEARGREVMCQPAGLADQLRSSNIPVLALGLNSSASPFDDAYLRALVEGEGCGSEPGLGEVFTASDSEDLVMQLGGLAASITGGEPVVPPDPVVVCDRQPCVEGEQRFNVDAVIGRLTILGQPKDTGVDLILQVPGVAEPIRIANGGAGEASGGAEVDTKWLQDTLFITTISLPAAPAMRGEWIATFVSQSPPAPGSTARSSIQVYADFEVDVTGPDELKRGTAAEFQISVSTLGAGENVEPLPLDSAEVTAVIGAEGGEPTPMDVVPAADGRGWTASSVIPADFPGQDAQITVTVQPQTRDIQFPAAAETFRFPVAVPDGLGTVLTKSLDFRGIKDTGTGSATIEVVGDDDLDGCIAIGDASFSRTTRAAAEPTFSAPEGCIEVPAGETTSVKVELTPGRAADLSVRGEVEVRVSGGDDEQQLTLPITAQFDRSVDFGDQVGRSAVLLAVGVGAPFLLMWLVGSLLARFRRPGELKVGSFEVRVSEEGVLAPDGTPLFINLDPFQSFASDGNLRDFPAAGTEFRARAPRSPFGAASGRAVRPGMVSVGPDGSSGIEAIVPLALRNSWVLHLHPSTIVKTDDRNSGVRYSATGTLLLFVRFGAQTENDLEVLRRVVNDEVRVAGRNLIENHEPPEGSPDSGGPEDFGERPPIVGAFDPFASAAPPDERPGFS